MTRGRGVDFGKNFDDVIFEQPHSNIQLILAKILRPISRKLGGEETNFAPKITILQPIGGICSGNSLLKPI